MQANPQNTGLQRLPSNTQYQAYNPNLHAAPVAAAPTTNLTKLPAAPKQPQRNFSTPNRAPQADYFARQPRPPQRSGTAPLPQRTTDDDSMAGSYYRSILPRPTVTTRAATAHGRKWRGGSARARCLLVDYWVVLLCLRDTHLFRSL